MEEVRKSHEQGYGFDNEEFAIGIGCLAVPIYDTVKNCIGSLGITGSIQAYQKKDMFQHMLSVLREASSRITQNLIQ